MELEESKSKVGTVEETLTAFWEKCWLDKVKIRSAQVSRKSIRFSTLVLVVLRQQDAFFYR